MNSRPAILGAIHAVIWVATLIVVTRVFGGSGSRAAYALLCAWWLTLYVALLIGTPWRAVPVYLAVMLVAFVVDAAMGSNALYHDPPPVATLSFVTVAALQVALWVSPFAVNWVATRIRGHVG
jgi:hypothetical protein